eukprot:comp20982_c0_seq1/m.28107 comp20982_c0_seq1/g.28107  ORF comp20982_c0_seq1/g.28107 comp20982_c0_seq1/m.28107 type:complete len:112 (-) comp20982_c0_seq1:947-1282(-)
MVAERSFLLEGFIASSPSLDITKPSARYGPRAALQLCYAALLSALLLRLASLLSAPGPAPAPDCSPTQGKFFVSLQPMLHVCTSDACTSFCQRSSKVKLYQKPRKQCTDTT